MAKQHLVYICRQCGASASKWIGKCPSCGEWNTYVEELVTKQVPAMARKSAHDGKSNVQRLEEISPDHRGRLLTPDAEFNRTLGGGLVPGSLVLIGGEPGIGKSTLLLQIAIRLAGKKILYVSGEESEAQIKMRAERIGTAQAEVFIYTETDTQQITNAIDRTAPDLVIIDSIQTLQHPMVESSPGSITQIRECANEMLRYAKEHGVPVVLIGHITKDGTIAGPKLLEHMVDCVLQFEGDRHLNYRILRTIKNRYGSTAELGIYEMRGDGLREVSNPSEILISQLDEPMSGIAVAATIEGARPMLIETQALVSNAVYGNAQRSTTGFELRRLAMLLAVLEKKCGFRLANQDVFLNIAGGLRVEDPAIDLAIVAAITSSQYESPVPGTTCFAGEVGLSGEIRAVNRIESRIAEAEKLGFQRIFISKYNLKGIDSKRYHIELVPCSKLTEAFGYLFG